MYFVIFTFLSILLYLGYKIIPILNDFILYKKYLKKRSDGIILNHLIDMLKCEKTASEIDLRNSILNCLDREILFAFDDSKQVISDLDYRKCFKIIKMDIDNTADVDYKVFNYAIDVHGKLCVFYIKNEYQ